MTPIKVAPPVLLTPRHGIVESGNVARAIEENWYDGVTFQPSSRYQINATSVKCTPDDLSDLQTCAPWITFRPYNLELGVAWSTQDDRDADAGLRAAIDIGSSAKLENLSWNGLVDVDSPTLSSAAPLVTTPMPPLAALAITQNELASSDGKLGVRGTLYMSSVVAEFLFDHLIEGADGRLRTKLGRHLVVVGDFNYPDAPSDEIVAAVGEPDVYLERITDASVTQALEELRARNDQVVRIQRVAMMTWDSSTMFKVPVDLSTLVPDVDFGDVESS